MPTPDAPRSREELRREPDGADRGILRRLRPLLVLLIFVVVVGVLYLAQAVLIPVALATLVSFLLSPVVRGLHRVGLPRAASVILVVALALSLVGGAAYLLALQVTSLADEIPKYRHNIKQRLTELRGAGKGGSLEKMQETVKEVVGEIQKEQRTAKPDPPRAVVVEKDDAPPDLWGIPTVVGRWLEPLTTAALVLALVIFMLLRRQELRNRLIRLIGYSRLSLTTKALDDAGERISRYLLMLSIINATFGLAVGIGLFFIGIPYALLWGSLAALLRFIPYVGAWLAAGLPTALALAISPGWTEPLLVLGLFVVIEPFIFLVLEPLIYGQSIGVSEVALLVAVAFWTWLWGPIGLLMATPLTVCVVVLGKYVPELEFLSVLMGDEPVMETHIALYQRLLAGDLDEASEIVEDYLAAHPRDQLYDEVLIPALYAAKRDRSRQRLSEEDERFILRTTREILERLDGREHARALMEAPNGDGPSPLPRVRLTACAAQDAADTLTLDMFRDLLDPSHFEVDVAPAGLLSSEIVEFVGRVNPAVVCIVAMPPGGVAHTRYLCKRLHTRFPSTRIIVGRWGPKTVVEESRDAILRAGADAVATSLREMRDQVMPMVQLREAQPLGPVGISRAT